MDTPDKSVSEAAFEHRGRYSKGLRGHPLTKVFLRLLSNTVGDIAKAFEDTPDKSVFEAAFEQGIRLFSILKHIKRILTIGKRKLCYIEKKRHNPLQTERDDDHETETESVEAMEPLSGFTEPCSDENVG
jgi:hypothetical protein